MPTSPVKKMKKATPFLPKLRVFKVVLLADRISQLDLSSLPSTFQVNELIKKTILYFAGFWWTKKKDEIIMKYRHNGFNLEDLSKSYRTTIESLVENFSSFQFSCL